MNRAIEILAAATLGAAILATPACATKKQEEDATADPDPRIGEEARQICFQSTISGWRSVKGVDNAVLLERGVNDWYYVELTGACRESLFRSAITIGIDSRPGGGCVSKGDTIIVRDSPGFTQRCFIKKIYKWDEHAAPEQQLKEDKTTDGVTADDVDAQ
ncbi:MAG: DUF6491 family protein [Parvularculaceae bacterium]